MTPTDIGSAYDQITHLWQSEMGQHLAYSASAAGKCDDQTHRKPE